MSSHLDDALEALQRAKSIPPTPHPASLEPVVAEVPTSPPLQEVPKQPQFLLTEVPASLPPQEPSEQPQFLISEVEEEDFGTDDDEGDEEDEDERDADDFQPEDQPQDQQAIQYAQFLDELAVGPEPRWIQRKIAIRVPRKPLWTPTECKDCVVARLQPRGVALPEGEETGDDLRTVLDLFKYWAARQPEDYQRERLPLFLESNGLDPLRMTRFAAQHDFDYLSQHVFPKARAYAMPVPAVEEMLRFSPTQLQTLVGSNDRNGVPLLMWLLAMLHTKGCVSAGDLAKLLTTLSQ